MKGCFFPGLKLMIIGNRQKKLKLLLKRITTYLERLSLAKKLFLSYFVLFAVPVVLLGSFFINNYKNNMKAEVLSRGIQDIRQIKSDVLNNLEMFKRTSQTVISTRNFIEVIGTVREYSVEEILSFKSNVLPNIENITNINTSINRLTVFIGNEYLTEMLPTLRYEWRIANKDWYKDILALKGRIYWRLNHVDEKFENTGGKNEEVVSLYREIRYENRHVGVLEINMLTKNFYGNVYENMQNDDYFVCVLDSAKHLNWNRDSKFFKTVSFNPESIKLMLMENARNDEGSFELDAEGMSFGVTYTYIGTIDSYIFRVASFDKINRNFSLMKLISILATALVILIFAVVTYGISSILLKKMSVVIDCMRKVQEGEMFTEIPNLGHDEIGELARHFQIMLNKINELIFTIVKKQAATKDAEIRALHSQINAHFIYNVLETLKMMAILEYKYDISDALTALGRLMRYGMSWKRKYVLLEDEIKHIKNYIVLLNIRFYNKIELCLDIDEHLYQHEILKMLLQPVVENAVKHGLEPKGNGGVVSIRAFVENTVLIIEIMDNGVGMDNRKLQGLRQYLEGGKADDQQTDSNYGIGLGNVNERIQLFYGKEFGLEVESEEKVFTRVRIRLPYMLSKNLGEMDHEESSDCR